MTDQAVPAGPVGTDRRAVIAANLAAVRARIAAAAADCGRDPAGITLVAVTKTFPATDVQHLVDLGAAIVGESRDQEARTKVDAVTGASWHFIGRLQRNKVGSVTAYADAVHSVDGARLATALGVAADRRGRQLEVFVQLSLDGDPARGGCVAAELPAIADAVAGAPALRLAGVMAVPPAGADPDGAYAALAELSARLQVAHPGAGAVSAGMSGDLAAAVRHGSTHLRIGSALLGGRPPGVG